MSNLPPGVTQEMIDRSMGASENEVMQSQCPRCKAWQDDYDGFGVLSCACGYCAHPATDGGACALCGAVQPSVGK